MVFQLVALNEYGSNKVLFQELFSLGESNELREI